MSESIDCRLAAVRSQVARAAGEAGRQSADPQSAERQSAERQSADPQSDGITLVAVSKRQSEARIEAALAAGQRIFGENRVQEAQHRWIPRRAAYENLTLHLIGGLQSNKARDAVQLFDVIETLDRPKLAKALADAVQEVGRHPKFFIQVNTGNEPQKSGVSVPDLENLLTLCRGTYALEIDGLMCIPPVDDPPAPHFALLADLAARHGLSQVSMGMTGDFETAIHQGSTEVRIGTAIFGPREE